MAGGLFFLMVATVAHVAMLVLGRWAAGVFGGRGSIGDALRPDRDTRRLALARGGAGVAGWYLAAALLTTIGLLVGGASRVDEASMRVRVSPGGPADRAGIRDGDRIVSVDGEPVGDWDALKDHIRRHGGDAARVEVERGGERLVLAPTPMSGRILVAPPLVHEDVGLGRALGTGLATPAKVVFAAARGFAGILTGREKAEVTGPVGIVAETGKAADDGTGEALRLAALLGAYFMPVIALASLVVALARGRRAKTVETEGKSQ
ncbi:MAG TPA: PDZ domain-containing protein [Labilithrix sp.]|jgi:membrane-associated protease RseP (regulator of RpoE activity)